MLQPLATVLICLFIGQSLETFIDFPMPGAALGMGILFLFFLYNGGPSQKMQVLFDGVSPIVPMFFVPAAAGVVAEAELLSNLIVPISVAILVGTPVTLVVVGRITQRLLEKRVTRA
ncbi:MAG: CidA/LrgA family protein [Pseudomonadota bacterium]